MKYFYGTLSAIWFGAIIFYSMFDFINNLWPIVIFTAFGSVNLYYFTKALKPQTQQRSFLLNRIIVFAAFASQVICLYLLQGGKTYFGTADIVFFFFMGFALTGISYRVFVK